MKTISKDHVQLAVKLAAATIIANDVRRKVTYRRRNRKSSTQTETN